MKYNPEKRQFQVVKVLEDQVMHDFAFAPLADQEYFEEDADNDGVPDESDAYPEDPNLAFNNYIPGESRIGTFAFEDLWPTIGDYDFNDLVVYYLANAISSADNKVHQINMKIEVANVGGSFVNGFGMRFNKIRPSEVESVSGTRLTEGIIETTSSGLEAGEDAATIIFFDNATLQENSKLEVVLKFNRGINWEDLDDAPNPFIFINGDRAREVHLPNGQPTSKFDPDEEFEFVVRNHDPDGNYKNDSGLPWAIHIPDEYIYTVPGVAINKAYLYFNQWVESSGAQYENWFTDQPGYRNEEKLAR